MCLFRQQVQQNKEAKHTPGYKPGNSNWVFKEKNAREIRERERSIKLLTRIGIELGKSKLGKPEVGKQQMDFMLGAAGAALLNIGLLGGIVALYIQSLRVIKSYFTWGLVIVASLFIVQNIVIVIFWSNLYLAGPAIKGIVDAAAPYLFAINTAQSGGLAVLFWITRR